MAIPSENGSKSPSKNKKKRNLEKQSAILEGALRVFGERGFEDATVAAICAEAGISEPTLYEYFDSKEDVLFSISEAYTRKELERLSELAHYIKDPRERVRAIIQAYLEFYENNPLYTSVALLTLKGNRRYVASPAYQSVRDAARRLVDVIRDGAKCGVFRDDVDPYLVRNMVLGFIEHLTIQWLLVGRPKGIAEHTDTIFHMVMRAIEREDDDTIEVKLKVSRHLARSLLGADGGN
ncbi:MAG: TetR/AcrR family transcriptional regulator [Myxococcales bacterium]|jgi:TetR/AcrR family fatty acid metabolism transcriptional regulator